MFSVSDVKSTQTLLTPDGAQILLLFFIARLVWKNFLKNLMASQHFETSTKIGPILGKTTPIFFFFFKFSIWVFFHNYFRRKDIKLWLYGIQKQSPEVFCGKRCSWKFCKIHRKTPVPQACNFIKKETLAQAFSCEFYEIF